MSNHNSTIEQKKRLSRNMLPLISILAIGCWGVLSFFLLEEPQADFSYPLWSYLEHQVPFLFKFNRILNFLVYTLVGYILIELNNRYTIIRVRASVQASFFILFVLACPQLYPLSRGSIASLIFVFSLHILFNSYQKQRPTNDLFLALFFLSLGTILVPQLFFLIPIYLLGAYQFQSLTAKSFFAGLIGLFVPYWFLFSHAFFYEEMWIFKAPFIALINSFQIETTLINLTFSSLLSISLLLILYLVSSIHFFMTSYQDKIRTRAFLNFLVIISSVLFLILLVNPILFNEIMPLLFIAVSFLSGHLFVLTKNRASNVFFICSTISLVFVFISNVWTLLYNS